MKDKVWIRKTVLSRVVPLLNSSKAEEAISELHGENKTGILKVIGCNDYQIREDRIVEFLRKVPALTNREKRKIVLMFELPVEVLNE